MRTAISPSQNDFGSLLFLLSCFGSRASSYRRAGKNESNGHLVLTYLSIRCAWAFGPTQREFGRFGPNEFPKIIILSWEINRNVLWRGRLLKKWRAGIQRRTAFKASFLPSPYGFWHLKKHANLEKACASGWYEWVVPYQKNGMGPLGTFGMALRFFTDLGFYTPMGCVPPFRSYHGDPPI